MVLLFHLLAFNTRGQFIWKSLPFSVSGDTTGPLVIGEIKALLTDTASDRLFIAGDFDEVDGYAVCNVISWDGEKWDSLPGLAHDTTGIRDQIRHLEMYNNELYAAGNIRIKGDAGLHQLVKWDGTDWSPVPGFVSVGIGPAQLVIHDLAVYHDDLYVCGLFDSLPGIRVPGICRWNGVQWSSVGTGTLPNPYSLIYSMAEVNDILYVGGVDVWEGYQLVSWDGNSWDSISRASIPFEGISLLTKYHNEIYAVDFPYGDFKKLEDDRLDTLDPAFGPSGSFPGVVVTGSEYADHLFVGGLLGYPGGLDTWGVACWNDTLWKGFGEGIEGSVNAMAVFKNELYIGGGFRQVDTLAISNLTILADTTLHNDTLPTALQGMGTNEKSILVFPNPVHGRLTCDVSLLEKGRYQLFLFDQTGKEMKRKELMITEGKQSFQLDLSSFPQGLYFLQLLGEQQMIFTKKISKN